MSTQSDHSGFLPFHAPFHAPPEANPGLYSSALNEIEAHSVPRLDYYGACRPAATPTGDFFEFTPLDGGQLVAAIGETDGPGTLVCTVKTAVKARFSGIMAGGPDALASAAVRLNRTLCNAAAEGALTTLLCACLDPVRRVLRYVSAGHEPALVFRASHARIQHLEPTGAVLGLFSRTVYRQRTLSLSPGDVLIAFTGGVADAVDEQGHISGEAAVAEALRESPEDPLPLLVERVLDSVARCQGESGQPADRTVIAIRFSGSAHRPVEERSRALAFAAA